MHYSPSTRGFYDNPSKYKDAPADLVPVTKELYAELMAGQAAGRVIVPGADGQPALADPAPPAPPARAEIEKLRLLAYADPITGSDRYRAEAEAERLSGNDDKAKEAESKWLARREEITQEFPWPVES
jgi:hypothetical protein